MAKSTENLFNKATISKNMALPSISLDSYKEHFTKKEWIVNNDVRRQIVEEQQKIAEKILKECERIKEQTEERTKIYKEATDRRIAERIDDVEFNTDELNYQRNQVCLELEALNVYKTRIIDCLNSLQENSLKPCKACLEVREYRVGIDLIIDDVEVALQKELTTILTWQGRLEKILEDTNEAMRRLRAARYMLDTDLQHKEYIINFDNETSNLKHTDLLLENTKIVFTLDPANVTLAEWEKYTAKNIQNAIKEMYSLRPIRTMIDLSLKQVAEDLRSVYINCNQALKNRIAEIRKVKTKLEDMLSETVIKIEAMTENINSLQKALDDKIPFMALASKRLEKRGMRPGVELVKDSVCHSLYKESEMIKSSAEQIQRAIQEAQTSLRHLIQSQINLQEDIKVKTNSLQIDECECFAIREVMTHFEF